MESSAPKTASSPDQPWVLAHGEDGQSFYTVGLFGAFNHPEFLVVGESLAQAREILRGLAQHVAAGVQYRQGNYQILGRHAYLGDISPQWLEKAVPYAIEQQGLDVGALQVVLADGDGRFPWSPGATAQPLLYIGSGGPRQPS